MGIGGWVRHHYRRSSRLDATVHQLFGLIPMAAYFFGPGQEKVGSGQLIAPVKTTGFPIGTGFQ
jgi:hypothetical protein